MGAAPRPIKIRIDTCRSLRDKIQRGHYVVVATLLERLAGKPLHFSGKGERRTCFHVFVGLFCGHAELFWHA
jgi:hypothetical protein